MIELIWKIEAIGELRKKVLTYHITPNINIQERSWHYDTIGTLFSLMASFFDPLPLKIKGIRG
jgi:hypothetical protein